MDAQKLTNTESKLITVENYPMAEIFENFLMPRTKETYTHDEMFSEFVPAMAVFKGVPIDEAFKFLSKTENMSQWTMSMRNIRPFKDDIYQADEAATPTGKVFIRTVATDTPKTIEWYAGHAMPDDLWIYYRGALVDNALAFGRKDGGCAFFWMNFVAERVRKDRALNMGFKMMFAAHMIEITNLKIILENLYGK